MSVLVTMRVHGDTGQFRRFLESDGDRLRQLASEARAKGCVHHRFALGGGYVLIVDEWESADAFRSFFSSNTVTRVMRDAGAQGQPEFEFAEAIESPDQF
jgi:hypothetical protein